MSVAVLDQMLEAVEGDTIELTCSSSEDIDTCIFTSPGNLHLNARASGAAYDEGRISVLEERMDSCGLKITGVKQEHFGEWK